MRKHLISLITIIFIFGFSGALLAQDDGITEPGETMPNVSPMANEVDVTITNISGTPITSIQRGNPISVKASYPEVQTTKGTCILLLPVNSPCYQERLVFVRDYCNPSIGMVFPLYIPGFIQIEGYAIAVVIIEGVGSGWSYVEVTP